MTKRIILDPSKSGVSGDMFLAALLDLYGDPNFLFPVTSCLLIFDTGVYGNVEEIERNGMKGKLIDFKSSNLRLKHPGELREILKSVSEELELSPQSSALAMKALDILINAAVKVKGINEEDLELYEIGSIETIFHIAGAAFLFDRVGFMKNIEIMTLPVAVGKGKINTMQGELEVPAPLTKEILESHNIPYFEGPVEGELTTPTGAAILSAFVEGVVDSLDQYEIEKSGAGFGQREIPGHTDAFRILIVNEKEIPTQVEPKVVPQDVGVTEITKEPVSAADKKTHDEVLIIETTIDDIDSEVIGGLFEIIMSQKIALDMVIIPAICKKNRPCHILKITAYEHNLYKIANILFKHLGTLGIRYSKWERIKLLREIVVVSITIDEKTYKVRAKIAKNEKGEIVNIKAEADDLLQIAKETGIPVRELKNRITLQARYVSSVE